MSNNTMLYALYRMGYHGRATIHGFRAMASTALNEMGFRPDVIERQLAHEERNTVRAAITVLSISASAVDDEPLVRLCGCSPGRPA